jgi:serpin B
MTYAGARGQTAEEMAKTLHFTLAQEQLHPAFARLIASLNGDPKTRKYQLFVANALWGQKGYHFHEAFLKTTEKNYGAGLHEVDYVKATEAARKTINAWVEKQTRDKIKNLIQPGVLDVDTRLVLTNAIYFKAAWSSVFSKEATRKADFRLTADTRVKVPTMSQTNEFRYLDGGTFQLLELPYERQQLRMLVFLPKKADDLPDFEKLLTADRLREWSSRLKGHEVTVSLPKFKFTAEFNLKKVLSEMGMKLAFQQGKADFSGMTSLKKLYIFEVIHKAFVDVHEKGTEAAAATAVVVNDESARISPRAKFQADHPFLFLIQDAGTGSILFLGRVTDPRSTSGK